MPTDHATRCEDGRAERLHVRTTINVPLTGGHIVQLQRRRYDLGMSNVDRLDGLDVNKTIDPDLLTEITVDRLAAQALDRVTGTYLRAIRR